MHGKCGIKCSQCAAYIGNIKSFHDQITCSNNWKKYLNISLRPEFCVCLGCQANDPWKDGNVIPDRSCLVRKCVDSSSFRTCADCKTYPCEHVKEKDKMAYTRKWVENRIGQPMTNEDYKIYVESFNTKLHINEIRKSIPIENLKKPSNVNPIKVKMFDMSKLEEENDLVMYEFLYKLQSANFAENYIEKLLVQRRVNPALVLLWVFGRDGTLSDDGYSLSISSKEGIESKEYKNIIRKRDNYWQGSASQVKTLLGHLALNMEYIKISSEEWLIRLEINQSNNDVNPNILKILKEKIYYLINKYGESEYVSAWKYKGMAFKKFKSGDFR